MKYQIRNVVVIGAGTMGAGIAAHLANIGVHVTLLDIIPSELSSQEEKKGLSLSDHSVRNRIVQDGFNRALKSRPASFFTPDYAALVSIGNLEDDFEVVQGADWVIEAIVENLEIKQGLMERIDQVRDERTIVSTNTSGIPVSLIAEGRSDGFRQHFLGTHFFNPPRYLKLVELIATNETDQEVVSFMSHFLEYRFGKGVVIAKDTPNFIGNRLGFASGAFALDYILKHGFTIEEVDAITGPVIGHPKTATFRLIDLVGIDVWEHVAKNLAPAIPHDEQALPYLNSEPPNNLIHSMVENGWLGNKTKQGFYKQVRNESGEKEFLVLNFKTMEYESPTKPKFDSIGDAKDEDDLAKRLEILLVAEDRAGELVRAITYQGLAYASHRIPEIADTPQPIDNALRWGFNHEAGPFETWDLLGVERTAEKMREFGYEAAPWVAEMLLQGFETFYSYENGQKVGAYNPAIGRYQDIKPSKGVVSLGQQKLIDKNPGAKLWDMGDGVACVEFCAKMNILDEDIITMIDKGLDKTDQEFEGLVLGTEADNFSAGANLFMVVMLAQNEDWKTLELAVKTLQDVNQRMRYFPKPVVAAPAGLALGGGLEILMHANRVVAGAELYTGPYEQVPGVIPAGGGTKELVRRILNPGMRTDNVEALPFLMRIITLIGTVKVSVSAEDAREVGFLRSCDRVVMNKDHLLGEAKKEVLNMTNTGYLPPLPEKIYAAGRDGLAALQVGIYTFQEGDYFTDHEAKIVNKAAYVMTGGNISRPTWVDEQYILDLEREAFLSLCGEEKTKERMWSLIRTGKRIRN
jgi:3-hydroxyacyl-CoA dehydrogenase